MAIANLTVRISAQIAELQKGFAEAKTAVEKFQAGVVATGQAVASVFGVGLGVAAITGFIRNTAAAAGQIVDLSNQLGISTDAVQRFQFVAGQTGTTVEAFGKAVFALGNNLASGDQSTVAGIRKLGLSFADLQKASPEKKLHDVMTALGGLASVQERNLVLTQLFGSRLAQELDR